MKDYVRKALARFNFIHSRTLHAPSLHIVCFGKLSQKPLPPSPTTKEITMEDSKCIEQVVGTCLYYRLAVDPTVLHALSAIASAKKIDAQVTLNATTYLLNYLATHPDAVLHYYASGMVLFVHSDTSYLTESEGWSIVGRHYFLSPPVADPNK